MTPDDPEVAELLDAIGTTAKVTAEQVNDPEAIRQALLEQRRRDVMG
jgi:hypothetical protein